MKFHFKTLLVIILIVVGISLSGCGKKPKRLTCDSCNYPRSYPSD